MVLAAGAALLVLLAWGLYVGWLAVDEAAVPAASALPAVPPGADRLGVTRQCGSGGCWRELRLRPVSGTSGSHVVGALGLRRERCSRAPLLDPRSTCVGARVLPGGDVVVYATYEW